MLCVNKPFVNHNASHAELYDKDWKRKVIERTVALWKMLTNERCFIIVADAVALHHQNTLDVRAKHT